MADTRLTDDTIWTAMRQAFMESSYLHSVGSGDVQAIRYLIENLDPWVPAEGQLLVLTGAVMAKAMCSWDAATAAANALLNPSILCAWCDTGADDEMGELEVYDDPNPHAETTWWHPACLESMITKADDLRRGRIDQVTNVLDVDDDTFAKLRALAVCDWCGDNDPEQDEGLAYHDGEWWHGTCHLAARDIRGDQELSMDESEQGSNL